MNKYDVDELYHNLRLLNVTEDLQQKEAILGITSHLTVQGGDYNGLLKYLAWYGEKFLLAGILQFLDQQKVKFSRVVEFGAGLAWLGRGIAAGRGNLPTLFIDKRQWVLTDVVADLESTNGRQRVLDALRPDDIIVMSELLHCLDNPAKALKPYEAWPILVVEYKAWNTQYMKSYNEQIAKFDCTPVGPLNTIFPRRRLSAWPIEPYQIAIVFPTTERK